MLKITSGKDKLTLTCRVTGDDIAGGYWERVNHILLDSENNKSSLSNGNTTIQLNITKARPDHSGKYRCVAYSPWGMAQSRNVEVNITSESISIYK